MISDLPDSLVPCGTATAMVVTGCGIDGVGVLQPVQDVQTYLRERKPQPDWRGEERLLATLFARERGETKALVRACELVRSLTKGPNRMTVQPACKIALSTFRDWHWNLKTFRGKYDEWASKQDWTVLVNRAKAPASWRTTEVNLSESFLDFCAKRLGQHNRDDAKREAWRSILRHWRTGRDEDGVEKCIPGYERGWEQRARELVPDGWSYSNIMRQLKSRQKFNRSIQALMNEGVSAARGFLPQVHKSRVHLRFMERVSFDDVKTDSRVFDPETGEVMDLWLLVAHDEATGMLLGFGMRPARAREDGSQEHLTLRDMKQLCGWLLERYGLPPYPVHWVFECGTATVSQGTALALEEFLSGRVIAHFTSMVGGTSPAGYREKAKGNSRGKASLESGNRLIHIIGSRLPGQTGPSYGKRPADLAAREKECKAIWQLAQNLPPHIRHEAGYPLLTLQQARLEIRKIAQLRNSRTDHNMEGFEKVLVWYNPADDRWHPQATAPDPLPPGSRVETRMESPDERAYRLALPYRDQWSRISPEIIVAFYESKPEPITVNEAGEIAFRFEGSTIRFRAPDESLKLPVGTKGIGYFHRDDPRFLHVTNGKGAILGTWLRIGLVDDAESLAEAIRYSATALQHAKEYAAHLGAEQRQKLEAMRAKNEELLQANTFVAVAETSTGTNTISSPVAHALTAGVKQSKQTTKDIKDQENAAAELARSALENLHG